MSVAWLYTIIKQGTKLYELRSAHLREISYVAEDAMGESLLFCFLCFYIFFCHKCLCLSPTRINIEILNISH